MEQGLSQIWSDVGADCPKHLHAQTFVRILLDVSFC